MEDENLKPTMKELATGRTGNTDIRGTTATTYALEPTRWLKQIVDAAKQQWYFMQTCYVTETPKGTTDVIVPKRSKYMGSTGITYATSTPADGTRITATVIDNLDGVRLRPTLQASRVTIGNDQLRHNALDVMKAAQEELSYSIGEKIDIAIATAIGDALSPSSTVSGMQSLYGGDATSDNTLTAGDVLTTELLAKARRLLMSKNKQYRLNAGSSVAVNGGGYDAIAGTVAGNPWTNTPDMPFVFYIGPAQQEAFLVDSQFTNAAEFGSRGPILNGEIPGYLGVRIVVTNNVEQVASGGTSIEGESSTAGTNMTRCLLLKAKKAAAFCWGLKPKLSFFNNIPEISQDVVLECEYDIEVLHADAIVCVDVADA
jgi:N4-gp56 family major capsid protein